MRSLIFLGLLLASPAFADESLQVKTANGPVTVALVETFDQVRVRLVTTEVPAVQTEVLGEEFQDFVLGGKKLALAAKDFDGDGYDEVIVRTTLPPHSGHLYVFRVSEAGLQPVKFADRDYLDVSHGGDVKIADDGSIAYETEARQRGPRLHYVRFDGQSFRASTR